MSHSSKVNVENRSVIIAPSLLAADLLNLESEVKKVEKGGADWHHVDVMDGHFVDNLTFGPELIRQLKKVSSIPLDVHIMVDNPDSVAHQYLSAGADLLTFHLEATHHTHRLIQLIETSGKKPGVAINPATPVSLLYPILDQLHHVLLMSVNPGFGGQKFIPAVAKKCRMLRDEITKRGLDHQVFIQVDGGINSKTIPIMAKAGANIYVAGSSIYQQTDRGKTIQHLQQLALSCEESSGSTD